MRSITVTWITGVFVATLTVGMPGRAGEALLPDRPAAPDDYTLLLAHFDRAANADHAAGLALAEGRGRIAPDGRFGGALVVAGRGEVTFAGADNVPGREGTVEFWLRPQWNGNDGRSHNVFSMSGGPRDYLNINTLPSGRFGAGMAGSGAGEEFVYRRVDASILAWKAGQWHHVAVCWKEDTLALWLDGQCVSEKTGARPPQKTPERCSLRGDDQALDELRISSVARYTPQGPVNGRPVAPHVVLSPGWKFVEPAGVYRAAEVSGGAPQAGMRLIPKDPFAETDPQQLPPAPQPAAVQLFAAPGQIEPAALLVVAQEALTALHIRPGELVSGSQKIPAERITVRRVVRTPERVIYTAQADQTQISNRFLARWQPLDIPQGELREVWLTVDVPADCPAGTYRGVVRLEHAGGRRELPVRLDVLPIRLVEHPTKQLGMYYRLGRSLSDEQRVLRELGDMRAHGVRHLVTSLDIKFLREGDTIRPDFTELREGLDLVRQAGFRNATIVVGDGLVSLALLLGHTEVKGKEPETFGDDPQFDRIAKQAVEQFLGVAREYPELRLVLTHMDEIFNSGRMPLYVRLARAVRQVPQAKLYITFNSSSDKEDELRRQLDPWVDIRCHHGYTFEWWLARGHTIDEYEKELQASGDEAWFYHNARGTFFTPQRARIINGLYLWAGPFRVHTPWIYQSYADSPFDDTDGPTAKGHDWVLSAPGPDDPADLVPSRLWEAMRAGADDLRYFATLEKAIADAPAGKKTEAAQAAVFLQQVQGLVRRSRPSTTAETSTRPEKPTGQIDLDTGLEMGKGVVGKAAEAPLIHALDQRFSADDWQRLRRQTADWIVKLSAPAADR